MAKTNLDKELRAKLTEAEEEHKRAVRLGDLKDEQRRKRLQRAKRVAQAGEIAARLAGQNELAEDLSRVSELAESGREDEAGALRQAGSNVGGRLAGKMAGEGVKVPFGKKIEGAGLSGGKAAAIGGAVSGALQGEGVGGIAKTSAAWWWLNIVFGALVIGEVTLVGILLALLAVAYLDFHYIMSKIKKGKGFFITMSLWQRIVLVISNIVVLIIPMVFIAIVVPTVCLTGQVTRLALQAMPFFGTAITAISGDYCPDTGIQGVPLSPQAPFGALDITITSAYRFGSIVKGTGKLSAHSRGEAVDIALRNPTVPEFSTDPRIAQLVQIALGLGFKPLVGDTLDEYTKPTEGASGGHIHVEFNLKSDGTTYCDGTKPSNTGPTDMVSLIGVVPVDTVSTSSPLVRPCMLDAVTDIFSAAGVLVQP